MPKSAAISESDGRESGRAAVLERFDRARLHELQRRLDELLPREGIADLDRGALRRGALVELLTREHGGAADSVSPGRRAVEDDGVTGHSRLRAQEPLGREEPDAHRVHEAVVAVGLVEHDLAAHGRHTDAVAVVADAADRSREVPIGLGKAESVEERDRPRTHGDDVAQNPSHSCRGALERLDRRGVVVALDLEGDGEAVTEIEHSGVLARPLQDARAFARKPLQEQSGVLVAAVLRPEEREDGELEVVRIALEESADALVLPVRQAECAMERRFRHAAQILSLSARARLRTGVGDTVSVASRGALLLALALPSRGDVGRLVPLHQGRGRGHPARRDDRVQAVRRGISTDHLSRGSQSAGAGRSATTRGLEAVPRPRDDQRSASDDARRLGGDAHRLEHRGDRSSLGADLRRLPEPSLPPARARSGLRGSPASPSASSASP